MTMDVGYECLKEHYTALMEQCGDFVLFLDLKFKIVKLNSIAQNILGVSKYKAIGCNLFEICKSNRIKLSFTEEDLNNNKKIKDEFFSGYILHPQEKKRYMLWKCSFINNIQQEKSNCFLIIGKDISVLENTKKNTSLTLSYLDHIIENLPEYIYWKDLSFTYRGCNKHVADYLGLPSPESIIGKTDRDFGWSEERVNNLYEIDKKVIDTGIPNIVEDVIPKPDNSVRVMLSSKTPLRDANNNIVGIVGISVDITDRRRVEKLQLEKNKLNIKNKERKKIIQEQEKFRIIAKQVAHDIRSPLASLSMVVKSCKSIPEPERIALRDITNSISCIANDLLSKYQENKKGKDVNFQAPQNVLLSLALLDVLNEKKHQYKKTQIIFNYSFAPNSNFVFININLSNFNRMISNLVNNAVESFEGKAGKVDLSLSIEEDNVKIVIQDNGKGMPKKIIDKVMNNIAVTNGKKYGNGLGLTQVRNTLQCSNGDLAIESKINAGTKVTLSFPQANPAVWLVKEIKLYKGDIVAILDDDLSIHSAWETKFASCGFDIQLYHFRLGQELINFVNSANTKDRIFLLSDFELISQKLDGLQIIEQLAIQQHSILVTSHYNDKNVCNFAIKAGIKILPKQLTPYVSIKVDKKAYDRRDVSHTKKADLVIIDDDRLFADSLADFLKDKFMAVETYYNPYNFLENLSRYGKETRICMDNDFHKQINGIELAKQLNEKGYTQLYMLSGGGFKKEDVPSYLTVLPKGDLENLNKLV